MRVKILHEGGKELKIFEDRHSALEWIGIEGYTLLGEQKSLRTWIMVVK